MKDWEVTVAFTFNLEAATEEIAQKRAEETAEAMMSGKPKAKRAWWPDLEAPEIEVEEN